MKRVAVLVACAALGCAELIGIREIPGDGGATDGSPSDVAPQACNFTTVLTVIDQPTRIAANGGFVFSVDSVGVRRCDVATPCSSPAPIVMAQGSGQTFANADVTSAIAYTLDDTAGGSIRTAALDGTNGKTLLTTAVTPNQIATLGADTFWVDDDTGDVHCIGCAGTADALWIQALGNVTTIFAGGQAIYALVSGGGANDTIYACGANAACASAPTLVVDSLDSTTTANQVAADALYVYAARTTVSDVVRVDANQVVKPVLQGEVVTALAVDPSTHDLFYATTQGEIGRVAADGTRVPLGKCASAFALAFDSTHVYAALDTATPPWTVISLAR